MGFKLHDIIAQFNSFFEEIAKAEINDQNELKVTIGSQTIVIELPPIVGTECIGAESKPKD